MGGIVTAWPASELASRKARFLSEQNVCFSSRGSLKSSLYSQIAFLAGSLLRLYSRFVTRAEFECRNAISCGALCRWCFIAVALHLQGGRTAQPVQ
jgi:hypothetical protein